MVWIKFSHSSGAAHINLEQTYLITRNSSTQIQFTDSASNNTIYSFSTSADADLLLKKINRVAKIIDIDQLANQG